LIGYFYQYHVMEIGEVGEYQRVGFKHDRFIENLKTIQKYFRPESPYAGEMGMQYNFQYTTTIWNVYHIFDFIQFMMENNFINSSEHIDFYYAWVPYHVALNNISQSEKDRLVEFLKNGMKTISVEKTISELNTLIKFINLDSNIDNPIENIVGYTSDLDKLHNTDSNRLNGIDFQGMFVKNISE
jgi:hypothetical protein